jgi:hypothetical protein
MAFTHSLMTDGGSTTEDDSEGEDQGRKRGFLSQSDRRYLRLTEDEREDEYSRPLRYERRQRIKERTGNAALDIPLLVQYADDEIYEYAFGSEATSEGMIGAVDTVRTRRTFPKFIAFLLRAILVEEPTRPIETTDDVRAVIRPFLDEVETGIEHWLNQEGDATADFEITPSVDKLQTIPGLIEELEIRRSPVTGEERLRIAAVLDRAGLGEERITELLGEEPDDDGDGSEFSLAQLAAMSTEQLAVLLDAGRISADEQISALEEKYGEVD